jgi:uncharacterized membrane protein
MLLLFRLSLVPFATAWMGENEFAKVPRGVYGVLLAAFGCRTLQWAIIRSRGEGSVLRAAIGGDVKGKASLVPCLVAIPSAVVQPWVACGSCAAVAAMWPSPDRRITRVVEARKEKRRAAGRPDEG